MFDQWNYILLISLTIIMLSYYLDTIRMKSNKSNGISNKYLLKNIPQDSISPL